MTSNTNKAIIATRGSKLALWQADYLSEMLREGGFDPEKMVIKTTGDRVQDRFLHEIGGKGLFIKELEQALLDGKADLAVHSMKDLPAKIAPEFTLPAVLKRHIPSDVLVFRKESAERLAIKDGPISSEDFRGYGKVVIATGSLRRQSLLTRANPDVTCVGLRGNVDTRLRKLVEGDWDAIVLAEASLERLGLTEYTFRRLDPEWFVPSAAQGALAIETASGGKMTEWLRKLSCSKTYRNVTVERTVLAQLGGDCTMPFGCFVREEGDVLKAGAIVLDSSGQAAETKLQTKLSEYDQDTFIDSLCEGLKKAGAAKILESLKLEVPERFK